jgi:hypothetical protein
MKIRNRDLDEGRTLSLDLVTLRESEVGREEVGLVVVGCHDDDSGGGGRGSDDEKEGLVCRRIYLPRGDLGLLSGTALSRTSAHHGGALRHAATGSNPPTHGFRPGPCVSGPTAQSHPNTHMPIKSKRVQYDSSAPQRRPP